MLHRCHIWILLTVWVVSLSWPTSIHAAFFADLVVSYVPGAGVTALNHPSAAIGSPYSITGEEIAFPNVLSPMNPAFEPGQVVQIGNGGHITLRLGHFALLTSGPEIGVINNVGLIDMNFPSGTATNPAAAFGDDTARVEVSEDGLVWVDLGAMLFNLPANFYINAGPFDTMPPTSPLLANFGKPFTGSLSTFDGLNYSAILAALDGSGGGTWLDLSGTGLNQIGYIRFSLDENATTTFELDAVVIANNAVGPMLPTLIPADFDGDSDVDGDDFLQWQNHYPLASGASAFNGDADRDFDVDGDDFLQWQNQFPFPAELMAIPQPTSVLSLATVWLLSIGFRRKK